MTVGVEVSSGASTSVIPQRFHRVWLGGSMPSLYEAYGRTWERHHPGWEMSLWTEANLPVLEHQDLYDHAEDLTAGSVWQFRSDLVRYEILWRHGGAYVDTDFECLRNIGPLIAGADAFAAWEVQDVWIANGFMGCTPGHPFVRRLIDGLPASVAANRRHRPNRSTGPQYLTGLYRRHGGLSVIDERHVYPYSYRDLPELGTARPNDFDTYAAHHWGNQRRRRGEAC